MQIIVNGEDFEGTCLGLFQCTVPASSGYFEENCDKTWHMKNAVFWDVAPCRFCVNRRFGGTSQKTAFFKVTSVKTSNLTNVA
jgi:hypothetical protein